MCPWQQMRWVCRPGGSCRRWTAKLGAVQPAEEAVHHPPVHRLDDLMVPRFCWLDLRLAWSLYSMKGLPVSTWWETGACGAHKQWTHMLHSC